VVDWECQLKQLQCEFFEAGLALVVESDVRYALYSLRTVLIECFLVVERAFAAGAAL
jgi:hypothetical protein